MEGAAAIATGQTWTDSSGAPDDTKGQGFAEAHIVQCDKENQDDGCLGGDMASALNWTVHNGGVMAEDAYPYDPVGEKCEAPANFTKAVTITGFHDVTTLNATALLLALNRGPVSVAVDASCVEFQNYQSGVFDGGSCGTDLDHGVLLTGYSVYVNKRGIMGGYYQMKNSWGAWGDGGYMEIEFREGTDQKGTMGVNIQPVYPTGALMAKDYHAPSFCGVDTDADKKKTVASCDQTAAQSSKCCCTQEGSGLFHGCQQWACCAEGTKCTKGKGCSALF
jgi:cathepsin L